VTKFSQIVMPEPIHRAAADLNFETPTTIQELVIPWLLESEQDLIALAQTGTGKTAAFGFPTLALTNIEINTVQTLILCPTRELCLQIHNDFVAYAKYLPRIKCAAIYGGASINKQKEALRSGIHIVIGTPGRINDMIRQKVLKIDKINLLILDEADEMLNIGFKEDILKIMSHTPQERQTLLFSATMSKEIEKLAKSFMKEPHRITAGTENKGAENILHYFFKVQARDKYFALKRIADMNPRIYGIVFCRTRKETQEIANKLQHDGYNADALHGELSQNQREMVMTRFRSKYVQLLIATDVAARGIDVDDLTHIINYHLPNEPEIYIHRTGRTGRAGKSGTALSIIHSKEIGALRAIEKRLGREINQMPVPTGRDICEKQLFHFIDNVERVEIDSQQVEPFLPKVYKKLSWLTREELIQRFVSVEFNRFLEYYKDNRDLETYHNEKPEKRQGKVDFLTFKLSIGSKQGLTKRELMRFINRLRVARSIEIGRIEIYDDKSSIELDAQYKKALLKAMNRTKYKGIDIMASCN
jgi:ATP-dependent RNA helicase DeaD